MPEHRDISVSRSHASVVDERLFNHGGPVNEAQPRGLDISHHTTGGVSGVGDTSELMADFCAKLLWKVAGMNQSSTMIPGASVHDRTGLVGQSSISAGDELKPIKSTLPLGEFNSTVCLLSSF